MILNIFGFLPENIFFLDFFPASGSLVAGSRVDYRKVYVANEGMMNVDEHY